MILLFTAVSIKDVLFDACFLDEVSNICSIEIKGW
jgi:hypothetical protein